MKKKTVGLFRLTTLMVMLCLLPNGVLASDSKGKIVHDGEYNFLKAQYGEKWAKEDKEIDTKLAEIRKKNGGKPNRNR